MKKGELTTITVDGSKIQVEYLGKGHWSTAYRAGNTVYFYTKEEEAMKEVLTHVEAAHVPKVTQHDSLYTGRQWVQVYSMPFYRNISRSDDGAWGIMLELESARSKAIRSVIGSYPIGRFSWDMDAHLVMRETIDTADIPESVRESLERLYSWAVNYGSSICFEFGRRNIGVDTDGNIIFRDILYDSSKLRWNK